MFHFYSFRLLFLVSLYPFLVLPQLFIESQSSHLAMLIFNHNLKMRQDLFIQLDLLCLDKVSQSCLMTFWNLII